jgi:hypothetical protein
MNICLNLSTGVVTNDKAIDCCGPVRSTFTAFANYRSVWTRSLARAAATDESVPNVKAVTVALTDGAGIDAGVRTKAVDIASPQPTGIEDSTICVGSTGLRTALPPAAFVPRETLGHGLNAHSIATRVQYARIIFLAAAVAIVGTGRYADSLLTKLAIVTCSAAIILSSSQADPGEEQQERHQGRPHQPAPIFESAERASKRVYPLVHLIPLPRGRLSLARVADSVTVWQRRLWLGNARLGTCVSQSQLLTRFINFLRPTVSEGMLRSVAYA